MCTVCLAKKSIKFSKIWPPLAANFLTLRVRNVYVEAIWNDYDLVSLMLQIFNMMTINKGAATHVDSVSSEKEHLTFKKTGKYFRPWQPILSSNTQTLT